MDAPRLSIIVPVYNEERTLEAIIPRIVATCGSFAEIICVDDGSRDRSLEILRRLARPQDIVITKPNGGKGDAIRTGLSQAHAPFVIMQDADLEYDPEEISKLLARAEKSRDGVVFGSRFLMPNPTMYLRYLLGNKVLSACVSLLFFRRITDSYTCYKLLPTDLLRSLALTSNGFEMEAEITSKCLKRGIRIVEIPITYRPRSLEEGKKINVHDAWRGIVMMLKVRLGLL